MPAVHVCWNICRITTFNLKILIKEKKQLLLNTRYIQFTVAVNNFKKKKPFYQTLFLTLFSLEVWKRQDTILQPYLEQSE